MPSRGLSSAQTSRIESLRNKHSALKARIKEAQNSYSTSDFYISQLKKQRLLVKEELEGMSESTGT